LEEQQNLLQIKYRLEREITLCFVIAPKYRMSRSCAFSMNDGIVHLFCIGDSSLRTKQEKLGLAQLYITLKRREGKHIEQHRF
jgi:hypothetical protein